MIIKVVKLKIIKLGTLFKVYGYYDILFYYMAKPDLGKSQRSDWFFLGRDFAVRTVSVETVQAVYFFFFWSKAGKFII